MRPCGDRARFRLGKMVASRRLPFTPTGGFQHEIALVRYPGTKPPEPATTIRQVFLTDVLCFDN